MIIYYLSLIFIPLIIVLIVYTIKTKYRQRRIIAIITILLLCTVAIVDNLSYIWDGRVDMPDQVLFEPNANVKLTRTTSRSYLSVDDEELKYLEYYDKKPYYLKGLMPVYFEEMSSYYIVVYSHDKDKTFEYNRYLQGDYERYHHIDRLVVIDKETGYIFDTTDHDLIGMEIDLGSFQEGTEIVTFNVFLPYEEKVSYIRYLYIDEDYSLENHRDMYENFDSDPMGGNWIGMIGHRHVLGDPSWVEVFELKDVFYLYQDSYGTTNFGYVKKEDGWMQFKQKVELTGQIYATAGYYYLTDAGIYYLNNNRQLVFVDIRSTQIIASNVQLDRWKDYIPVDAG